MVAGALEKVGSGLGAGAEDSAGLNAALMGPPAGAAFGAEAETAACAGLKGLGSEACADLNGPEGAADCAGCAALKGLGSDDVAGLKGLCSACADINA